MNLNCQDTTNDTSQQSQQDEYTLLKEKLVIRSFQEKKITSLPDNFDIILATRKLTVKKPPTKPTRKTANLWQKRAKYPPPMPKATPRRNPSNWEAPSADPSAALGPTAIIKVIAKVGTNPVIKIIVLNILSPNKLNTKPAPRSPTAIT